MISISEFRRRVASLDGERLETEQRRRGFTVRVTESGLEYTPESSGKPRPDSWSRIERFLDRYNEIRSTRTAEYHEVTHHSSYLMAILRRLLHATD
jgi:hypothetical protein